MLIQFRLRHLRDGTDLFFVMVSSSKSSPKCLTESSLKSIHRTPDNVPRFQARQEQDSHPDNPLDIHWIHLHAQGKVYIGNKEFEGKAQNTLTFSEDGAETVRIQTKDEDGHRVFIAGEPLKAPIVQRDPFVMSTAEEIFDILVE